RKALFQQIADIMAQDELIDRLAFKAAANENRTCATKNKSQPEKVQIDTAENMQHRQVILIRKISWRYAINIGFMGEQKYGRMVTHRLAKAGKFILVEHHFVFIALRQHEPVQPCLHIYEQGTGPGNQFLHIFARFFVKRLFWLIEVLCEPGHFGAKLRAGAQTIRHKARHFVAASAKTTFFYVEHQTGLTNNKTGKFVSIVLLTGKAVLAVEPFPQFTDGCGAAGQAMCAALVPK